jgi:hypothetical protein
MDIQMYRWRGVEATSFQPLFELNTHLFPSMCMLSSFHHRLKNFYEGIRIQLQSHDLLKILHFLMQLL